MYMLNFRPYVNKILPVICVFASFELFGQSRQLPFQNPVLSSEQRAADLISRLTLVEKASLMFDQSPAIPRLGIKPFNWWSEALHGLANNDSVTVFPEPIGMAASFDDSLVYKVFNATSDEVRAKYNQALKRGEGNKRFLSLSVWTPNVNIFRDPRWGRGQETYGEDPYLTSRMGVAVVEGLQGSRDSRYKKLLACAKHFAVHSGPEWSRHTLNLTNLDARDLWETYLPAFKALVQQADVREVMCAYQRLDNEPCCGSTNLLQHILRDKWGYKYLVVSDCGAVTDFYTSHHVSKDAIHAASKAVLSGTDVECVWQDYTFEQLPEAAKMGLLKEADINRSLMRVLTARFDLGEMDNDSIVPWAHIPASVINNHDHQKLALKMARESMTLLLNKNSILPLSGKMRRIAVIGPNADNEPMLWGNYNGTPVHTISILDGIKQKAGQDHVFYDKACDLVEDKITNSYFDRLSFKGNAGLQAVYWNNREFKGTPVIDKQIKVPLKLTTAGQHQFAAGVALEGFSAKYISSFEAEKTEKIVFKFGATGHFKLRVNGDSLAEYNNWRTVPSKVYYDVQKGRTYKIEIEYAQLNNWQANLEFDFGSERPLEYDGLIRKLAGVDTVIFVGGLSTLLEGEEMPVAYEGFKGGDRTSIELPKVQRNCLKALKAAGKKVIFVNCSGSAIALTPETESCEAILQAWYGGESGGRAVADVLFGDYNPSGKLPVTFYKSDAQLRGIEDYSMSGRTYRHMSDPLFQFGFGLSYTKFVVGAAQMDKKLICADDTLSLSVPVANTGKRNGAEVLQIYIRQLSDPNGPLKTLRAFKRVEIPAGDIVIQKFELPYQAFEFYNRNHGRMEVTPGKYTILYGNSSADKDLKRVTVSLQ